MAAPSVSNVCEASPPPYLRLPLIISESLRSAISADGSSTQGIVSILLSGADVVKLDLSKLQLFAVDGIAVESAASMASSESTEVKALSDDDFTFQTPLVLSPVADLPPGSLGFPVLKSKGVVEAEKATAEHHLLKLGAVSPSPRARRKAVSMDEISWNESLSSLDNVAAENVPRKSNCIKEEVIGDRVRAKRQLPELELARLPQPDFEEWVPLPHPAGLEQRAEKLKKKHFERVLSRKLREVRSEGAKIDLKASPAAKFLLQVMPWELTPPVTPITTPAAIPFIWEDVPGRPKPRELPSSCQSLPLPPRLVPAPPPPSSSAASCASASSSSDLTEFADGDRLSSAAILSTSAHGRRHRRNTHSWHVLQSLFSGSNQRCLLQSADTTSDTNKASESSSVLRLDNLSSAREETGTSDNVSAMSSCVNSNSTSLDLSPSINTPSEEQFRSCETSLSACYELPPLYMAPVTSLTPSYKDLGPLDDDCSKQSNRFSYLAKLFRQKRDQRKEESRAESFFYHSKKHDKVTSDGSSNLLDGGEGGQLSSRVLMNSTHVEAQTCSAHSELVPRGKKNQSAPALLSPTASSLYRSPTLGRHKVCSAIRSRKFIIKLRRRGARVVVAAYKAIKRALYLKGTRHCKLSKLSQLPYHTLHR